MQSWKILHVMHTEKFIEPFIDFVEDNFDEFENDHLFFIWGDKNKFGIKSRFNVKHGNERKFEQLKYFFAMVLAVQKAEKIILHGLFVRWHLILLTLMPWNLKKCYWSIWGGDLYRYKLGNRSLGWRNDEIFRRFLIKRIGHIITPIEGDYMLSQKWYGAKAKWHECFMYPSNLYQEAPLQSLPHQGINILLGNSADPSNNHIEVLDKLKRHVGEDIKVYCPLSYGDQEYAHKVTVYGASYFGENFVAVREFMPFDKYTEFLATIDIAIFNHKRQQGLGNITTLLGFGKKVYLRKEITTWSFLHSLGVTAFDMRSLDLSKIKINISNKNSGIIAKYFSKKNLLSQLECVFE